MNGIKSLRKTEGMRTRGKRGKNKYQIKREREREDFERNKKRKNERKSLRKRTVLAIWRSWSCGFLHGLPIIESNMSGGLLGENNMNSPLLGRFAPSAQKTLPGPGEQAASGHLLDQPFGKWVGIRNKRRE